MMGFNAMIEKKNLDLPDIRINEEERDADPGHQATGGEDDAGSVENPAVQTFSARAMAWARKPLVWIIFVFVFLSGSIGARLLLPLVGEHRKAAVESKQAPVPANQAPADERITFFGEFVFDQNDEKGRLRIAFCDIAVELEKPQPKDTIADRVDLREVVYTVLKTGKGQKGLSKEGRNRLKDELKSELNKAAGENFVKTVYVTAYELH